MRTLAYTAKLGFTNWKTSIKTSRIDGLSLDTYNMALARFSIHGSLRKVWFLEKTFLLANTSIKIVLGMLFLAFSNINFLFDAKKFT